MFLLWFILQRASEIPKNCWRRILGKTLQLSWVKTRRNWNILYKLIGRKNRQKSEYFVINGENHFDQNILSNPFCEHFINPPLNIHSSIPLANNDYIYLIPYSNMFFHNATKNYDSKHICDLKKMEELITYFADFCRYFILFLNIYLFY